MINLLEHRQDETIRRIAYNGRDSANSHSANSLSSNNSSNSFTPSVTAIQGRPPGRVRQMFDERRRIEPSGNGNVTSPVGWDKSYPLKPVVNNNNGAGLYKRNSTVNLGNKPNKYSGNYGPKSRSSSVNRAVSMDRSRYAPSNESGYSSASMARTRSHHQLNHHSSGEDSYGSSSRPPSRGGLPPASVNNNNNYATYGGRSRRARSSYDVDIPDDEYSPPGSRKTSYTYEYVRNLPPTTTATTPRGRLARSSRLRDSSPSTRSSYDPSSYSSQSSDKSDPYMTASRSHHHLGSAYGGHSNSNVTHIPGPTARSASRSRLHSTSFRLVW